MLSTTVCRRLEGQHRRASAAQVFVRRVGYHIGIGRIMDCSDLAVSDAEGLVDNLHDRSETIGGAGRCRDDWVLARIIEVVVDAYHHV